MEEIYGLFNELDSSQLNYVKAGEFLPDDYKEFKERVTSWLEN